MGVFTVKDTKLFDDGTLLVKCKVKFVNLALNINLKVQN